MELDPREFFDSEKIANDPPDIYTPGMHADEVELRLKTLCEPLRGFPRGFGVKIESSFPLSTEHLIRTHPQAVETLMRIFSFFVVPRAIPNRQPGLALASDWLGPHWDTALSTHPSLRDWHITQLEVCDRPDPTVMYPERGFRAHFLHQMWGRENQGLWTAPGLSRVLEQGRANSPGEFWNDLAALYEGRNRQFSPWVSGQKAEYRAFLERTTRDSLAGGWAYAHSWRDSSPVYPSHLCFPANGLPFASNTVHGRTLKHPEQPENKMIAHLWYKNRAPASIRVGSVSEPFFLMTPTYSCS